MTKERIEEAERILTVYAQKYGLSDEARDYFAKWQGEWQQQISPLKSKH